MEITKKEILERGLNTSQVIEEQSKKLSGKKLVFRYRIFLGKEQISDEAIILSFPSKQQHNEIIKSLIESIYLEVQKEAK
jgi:hypothetical protein